MAPTESSLVTKSSLLLNGVTLSLDIYSDKKMLLYFEIQMTLLISIKGLYFISYHEVYKIEVKQGQSRFQKKGRKENLVIW